MRAHQELLRTFNSS